MSRTEALLFINVAHFFTHFFLLIFPTAAIALSASWDRPYGEVLMLGAPVFYVFALATPVSGWLGDRCDRFVLLSIFFLGCGGAAIGVAVSRSQPSMVAFLALIGLFASIYHPVGLALVTEIAQRKGRGLAVNGVFGNMGLAGSAIVTGGLANWLGWYAAFLVPGVLSVVVGCLLFARLNSTKALARNVRPAHQNAVAGPVPPSQRRAVIFVIILSALVGGAIFNILTISLPKFFEETLFEDGSNLAKIGAWTGLIFAVAAFAQLPVGEFLDRIGARRILLVLLTAQIGCLAFLPLTYGPYAFALSLILVTCVFAEIPISTWLIGRYVSTGMRSRAVSMDYTLSLGVAAVAVPAISTLHNNGFGFGSQFQFLAVAAICVLIAAWSLPGHGCENRSDRNDPDPISS